MIRDLLPPRSHPGQKDPDLPSLSSHRSLEEESENASFYNSQYILQWSAYPQRSLRSQLTRNCLLPILSYVTFPSFLYCSSIVILRKSNPCSRSFSMVMFTRFSGRISSIRFAHSISETPSPDTYSSKPTSSISSTSPIR